MSREVDVMKRHNSLTMLVAIASVAVLLCCAKGVDAQESPEPSTPAVPPAEPSEPAVQVSEGVADVLKLTRAKVPDDVTVAFIESSGRHFKLTTSQILDLRKEGVSDRVLVAMLRQPSNLAIAAPPPPTAQAPPAAPAPSPAQFFSAAQSVLANAPEPVYVASDSGTYYSASYPYSYASYPYYSYASYPYYGYGYPACSLGFSFGLGCGYYGGYYCGNGYYYYPGRGYYHCGSAYYHGGGYHHGSGYHHAQSSQGSAYHTVGGAPANGGKNAMNARGSGPTRNFASGNSPVSGNPSGGSMSRVTHANAPGPTQMRSSVVPRQSFTSAPGANASAVRPSFASAPRPSFASAPRASFASAPRASFAGAPRASFASAPRASFSGGARASFSGAARGSFSGMGSRGGGGRYR